MTVHVNDDTNHRLEDLCNNSDIDREDYIKELNRAYEANMLSLKEMNRLYGQYDDKGL